MASNADDDLEYHVTFPTPTPVDDIDGGYNKFVQSGTETAVLLIGWMNCKDQYLAKYSKLYEDKGFTTVRYNPTRGDLRKNKAREVARKLLEVIVEMNLEDNPVLFHIFSNGGCTIYNEMREQLASNSDFEDINKLGVIYDSAPGRSKTSTVIDAYFYGYPNGVLTNALKTLALFCYSMVKGANYLLQAFGLSILPNSIYDEMMFAQDGCPELYLYSTADEVISAKDIEEIIQRRRMQGVDISTICWDDSPHVQHLKTHREVYIKQCYDFVSKCLQFSKEGLD